MSRCVSDEWGRGAWGRSLDWKSSASSYVVCAEAILVFLLSLCLPRKGSFKAGADRGLDGPTNEGAAGN